MDLLALYGSPRVKGNSELLLDVVVQSAAKLGVKTETIYLRKLSFSGCVACGGCEKTGVCVIKDDMTKIYPLLQSTRIIVVAFPIFFYGPPAITKAFMDRAQAFWNGRALRKPPTEWKNHENGIGYVISVGATKGENLFTGSELITRYFYDALDKDYGGGMFFRNLDAKGAILNHKEYLSDMEQWANNILKCKPAT